MHEQNIGDDIDDLIDEKSIDMDKKLYTGSVESSIDQDFDKADQLQISDDLDINECIKRLITYRFIHKQESFLKELQDLLNQRSKDDIGNSIIILCLLNQLAPSKWKTHYIANFMKFVQNCKSTEILEIVRKGVTDEQLILMNHFLVRNKFKQIVDKVYECLSNRQIQMLIQHDVEMSMIDNIELIEKLYKIVDQNQIDIGDKSINLLYCDYLKSECSNDFETFKEYLIQKKCQYSLIQLWFSMNVSTKLSRDDLVNLIENNMFAFMNRYIDTDDQGYNGFFDYEVQKALNYPEFYKKQDLTLNLIFVDSLSKKEISENQKDVHIENLIQKGQLFLDTPEIIDQNVENEIHFYCLFAIQLNELLYPGNLMYNNVLKLRNQYIEIAYSKLSKIGNAQTLKTVLFLPNTKGNKLIDILVEYRNIFSDIFKCHDLVGLIEQTWTGDIEVDNAFFSQTFQANMLQNTSTKVYSQKYLQANKIAQRKVETNLRINQDNEEFVQLLQKSQNKKQNSSIVSYNIFSILEKFKTKKTDKFNSPFMFEIFQINQAIRKIVDQITTLILTVLVLYQLYNMSSQYKPAYMTWNSDYVDFFYLNVPSAYSSNVTINQTGKPIFKKYVDKAEYNQMSLYCMNLFENVFTFNPNSSSLKTSVTAYCGKFIDFKISSYSSYSIITFYLLIWLILQSKFVANLYYQSKLNQKLMIRRDVQVVVTINSIVVIILLVSHYYMTYEYGITYFTYYFYLVLKYSIALIVFCALYQNLNELQIYPYIGTMIGILKQINLEIGSFLLFYISKIFLLSGIYFLLFKGLDSEYDSFMSTFTIVASNPLGNYYTISDSTSNTTIQSNLIVIHNWVSLFFQFYMMIIVINILIAILSNVYNEIVSNSKMQIACSLYQDYHANTPDELYSSINLLPNYLSFLYPIIIPVLEICKSRKVNRGINVFNYCTGFFIIIVPIYIAIFIVMMVLNYFYFLYKIINFKYTSQTKIRIDSFRFQYVVHFISFLILGPFYLLYKLGQDIKVVFTTITKPIYYKQRFLFDMSLWISFQMTVFSFDKSGQTQIELKSFGKQLEQQYKKYQDYDKAKLMNLMFVMAEYIRKKEIEKVDINDLKVKMNLCKMNTGSSSKEVNRRMFESLEMQFNRI